jgi:hypothetical protein
MVKDFVSANQVYTKTFDKGHLEIKPSKDYIVGAYESGTQSLDDSHLRLVTCMDARVE